MHPIEHLRYLARSGHVDAPELVIETASALRGLGTDPASLVVTSRRIVERHPLCGPLWWLCAHMLMSDSPRDAARRCGDDIRSDPTAEFLSQEIPDGSLVCVNGWSPDVVQALALAGDIEVCVVDGDNGADYLVRVLERLDIAVHLVDAAHGGAAAAASDIVVLSAFATGSTTAWCNAGSLALASVAYCSERRVLLSSALGTRLPDVLFAGVVKDLDAHTNGAPWHREADEVPFALCTTIIGSDGPHEVSHLPASGLKAQCPPAVELLTRSAM